MNLLWIGDAWEEYCSYLPLDRNGLQKINRLIEDIGRHPFTGLGKPEPLKHQYAGWWSRRIDRENRLVYKIENAAIVIAECKTHYAKK